MKSKTIQWIKSRNCDIVEGLRWFRNEQKFFRYTYKVGMIHIKSQFDINWRQFDTSSTSTCMCSHHIYRHCTHVAINCITKNPTTFTLGNYTPNNYGWECRDAVRTDTVVCFKWICRSTCNQSFELPLKSWVGERKCIIFSYFLKSAVQV